MAAAAAPAEAAAGGGRSRDVVRICLEPLLLPRLNFIKRVF